MIEEQPESLNKPTQKELTTQSGRGALAIAPSAVAFTPALESYEINERVLIIDTETTGRSVTSEIIEIAFCRIDGTLVYDSLVRPTIRVPLTAARIHGLTTEMLTSAPTWENVWSEIESALQSHLLVAYNAAFDRRMIELMAARYKLSLPQLRWRCAMRYIKQRAGWKKTLTLSEACQLFQIVPGTHRAATDACATAAILRQLR